jgi:hypothetical protein
MFDPRQPDKRPGDATTSRGMAPKVELRRITTIPAFACPDDRGMAMTRVSVEVPAALVGQVRETVLMLYEMSAESLHLALKDRAVEEARRHQGRVDDLEDLTRQLDRVSGPVRVAAPRDLVHDVLYGALVDAGERLAATSNRCWRGELPLDRVQEVAEEVLALDSLLRELDGGSLSP